MTDVPGFQPSGSQPVFDPKAPHQQKPRLRAVRLFPAQVQGTPVLGIADARQISDKMCLTMPAAQLILPLLDGKHGLDEIVRNVGQGLTRPVLEQLVAQLDDAGLLEGPTFEALRAKVHAEFDSATILPPGSSAQLAEALAQQAAGTEAAWNALSEAERQALGSRRMREVMDDWIAGALKDVSTPAMDELPKAIVAPHLDYQRGWINYASIWGRLRVAPRPDRVVVLGTNHFGEATGVCGCDKGYETPLGVCEPDAELIEKLSSKLGNVDASKLFSNRYDHEREHSIELQVPWIQHILGKDDAGKFPKVFGALVHDPSVNGGESYDGKGLALEPFVNALRDVLSSLPGRTLVVSSADLSHAGANFGDQQPLAGEDEAATNARNHIFRHDRDMLMLLVEKKPDELIAAMSWQANPTRWCSVGNLVATMKLVNPDKVEVLNYAGAMDEQGMALVTSVAMVMA